MMARVGLLLLISVGPQLGLGAKSDQEAIEITASGVTSLTEGDLKPIRRQGSQGSTGYSALATVRAPDTVEPTSVDADETVDAAAAGTFDTVSLCGQTCKSVVEGGAPCDAFYGSGCKGNPPPGFTTLSELYDLCPIACGPKPDTSSGSLVLLWVFLIILCLPLMVIGVIAAFLKIFYPKTYDMYKARAQQVTKSWQGRWNEWKYGIPYEYESWDDEEEWDEDEEDEADDGNASKSYIDDASASGLPSGSQSYMDDGSSQSMSQSMMGTAAMDQTMMPSGTMMMGSSMMGSAATMMPDGTTMMPTMMGSSATMMQEPTMMMGSSATMMQEPTMMMGSSATMMQEPTMMMGSSATMMQEPTMMMGSSATMMQEPTMMMGSSATMMDEQPTMAMGSSMMGSSVMDDQATMQNFSSTDTL